MRRWAFLIVALSLCVSFGAGGTYPEYECYEIIGECTWGGYKTFANSSYSLYSTMVGTRDMDDDEFLYIARSAMQYEDAIRNQFMNHFSLYYLDRLDIMPADVQPGWPNLVWWPDEWVYDPSIVGYAKAYYDVNCEVASFDIVLNDEYGYDWGNGWDEEHQMPTVCTEYVILHELGHIAGLADIGEDKDFPFDPCWRQVMWRPWYAGVKDTTFGVGDRAGLIELYVGVPVTDFTATGEEYSVRLEWNDSCVDTCRYEVRRASRFTGPYVTIDSIERVGHGAFEYVDYSVERSLPYCYRLEGEGTACATPLYMPDGYQLLPPTELIAEDVVGDCGGAVMIGWVPSESWDVDGYHVYRHINGLPESEQYVGSAVDPPFIDSTALTGVEYSYFAVAYDEYDLSEESNYSICASVRDVPVLVSSENSSVEISKVDSLGTCPLGDLGKLEISINVRDQCDWPVWDLPAEEVFAVTANSPGGPVSCLDDTIYASSATNGIGKTVIEIARIGGCGEITFDVYADGVLIGQPTIWVTSPDVNGDCVVDSGDGLLFMQYFNSNDPCADLDGQDGVDLGDWSLFGLHCDQGYHFCIDPDYSSASLTPSSACLVLCPKGDIESFFDLVIARSALNAGFPYSSIPADSIWITIREPGPGTADFRFSCRPDHTKATADSPTWGPEKTTITVNSGGGSSTDWDVRAYIGGQKVGVWTGLVKSPDIDASGSVNGSDISIWSIDFGSDSFRSDLDCSGQVGNEDFDMLNAHYKHGCSASSQMMAGDGPGSDSWTVDDAEKIRSHLSDYLLDALLAKDLHPDLKALLTYARSLAEPEGVATTGGQVQAEAKTLLPRFTSVAQSVPNPFKGTAVINYQVAPPGGRIEIVIFDVAGRRVRTLLDQQMPPGFYVASWDGRNDDGRRMASGIYFYIMRASGFTSNKRMILVR